MTLDDGRLAAGGPDGVRVWDLDNEERRPIGFAGQATVDGMASLKDGTCQWRRRRHDPRS